MVNFVSGPYWGEKALLFLCWSFLFSLAKPDCLQCSGKLVCWPSCHFSLKRDKIWLQSHRVLSTRVNEWSDLCSSPDELPPESAALLTVCLYKCIKFLERVWPFFLSSRIQDQRGHFLLLPTLLEVNSPNLLQIMCYNNDHSGRFYACTSFTDGSDCTETQKVCIRIKASGSSNTTLFSSCSCRVRALYTHQNTSGEQLEFSPVNEHCMAWCTLLCMRCLAQKRCTSCHSYGPLLSCFIAAFQGDLIDAIDDAQEGWQYGENTRTGA